jgi:hypothetical protein
MSFQSVKYQIIKDDFDTDMSLLQDYSGKSGDHREIRNSFFIGADAEKQDHLDSEPRKFRDMGTLYLFTPTKTIPRLRLFDGHDLRASLKSIIRRETLLVLTESNGDWHYILCQEFEGWCQFSLNDSKVRQALKPTQEYPRYLEWKGDNVFLCGGKLMFGSDFNFFVFTNILFIISCMAYFIFVVPYMYEPELCMVSISNASPTPAQSLVNESPFLLCLFCCFRW